MRKMTLTAMGLTADLQTGRLRAHRMQDRW